MKMLSFRSINSLLYFIIFDFVFQQFSPKKFLFTFALLPVIHKWDVLVNCNVEDVWWDANGSIK